MKVTLLDGSVKTFNEKKTVREIAASIAISLGKQVIGGKINDVHIVAPSCIINRDCRLEFITENNKLAKAVGGYTAAFAYCATIHLLRDLQVTRTHHNPDGTFLLFFDVDRPFKKEDLTEIDSKLKEIIGTLRFNSSGLALKDDKCALELSQVYLKDNPDYSNLMKKISYLDLTTYSSNLFPEKTFLPSFAFYEDCSKLKGFKLLSSSAYQKEENGKTYQMIRGIASVDEKYVNDFIEQEEENKKKDHRYIGKQQEIFTIDPLIGQGLPIWLPNGTILKDEIKKYLKEKEWEYDFVQIQTPVIGTVDLYKTSGHWDHYREDMFAPMKLPKEEMVLKPMSCPHHIAVYNFKPRSYRDLPLRFAEHALQYRYESSGSLTGLERVRAMELTDSHIFCRQDQIKDEFKHAFKLIQEILKTFHIKIDYLSLSVRDPKNKEKYFDDDKMWNDAEQQLQDVLDELGVEYVRMEGEAAFYGPKLDIQALTVLGHEITISTLQLDFLLPMRFDLKYIVSEGKTERPVMIHRGLIGTYERFISVLLEQTGGVLPLWLSPVQVEIIPINQEGHAKYCDEIKTLMKKSMIRTHIDSRDERLNYKIREAQVNKIPFTLVIGDDEKKNKEVTIRRYGSTEQETIKLDKFIKNLNDEISSRK